MTIEHLRSLLASPAMIDQVIKTELLEIKERFADHRRTRITGEIGTLAAEDLIPEEKL